MPPDKISPKTALTSREKAFIRNFVQTRKIGDSALRAGYADKSYGSFLMAQPKILNRIQEVLEKHGLTDDYVAQKLAEGCEATYPEKRTKDGAILQDKSPDFFTRGQYLDKVIKIKGLNAPDRLEIEHKQIVLNINIQAVEGLLDAGAITEAEAQEIKEAEVIEEGAKKDG